MRRPAARTEHFGLELEKELAAGPILISLGANLPSAKGAPRSTLEAALETLELRGIRILKRSRFWRTRPEPDDGQPWYANAVAMIKTDLPPGPLLETLLKVEGEYGRIRVSKRYGPRSLDIDLLAYGSIVLEGPDPPILPHPRLSLRAFVLMPLMDIVPSWRHPVSGQDIPTMLAAVDAGQTAVPES